MRTSTLASKYIRYHTVYTMSHMYSEKRREISTMFNVDKGSADDSKR